MKGTKYDIVLFGATGFTGRLVARVLDERAKNAGFTFALSGRNPSKLEAVRRALRSPNIGLIAADVNDHASMVTMAHQAKVVLTTVGPYAQYGSACVRACLEARSDYLDITGEPGFVMETLRARDEEARSKGVLLVNCCGFDSMPADLGALYTVKQLPGTGAKRIKAVVQGRFRPSGGTWASALHAVRAERGNRSKKPERRREKPSVFPSTLHRDETSGAWAVPMPVIDPWIVKRSRLLRGDYGTDFRYAQFYGEPSLFRLLSLGASLATFGALAMLPVTRSWLLRRLPSGDGPSEVERQKNHFSVTFVGSSDSSRVVTRVSGRDPGYDETSKMVAEAAIMMATRRTDLFMRAGVLTPAAAFGEALIPSLQAAGIRFETLQQAPRAS